MTLLISLILPLKESHSIEEDELSTERVQLVGTPWRGILGDVFEEIKFHRSRQ